MATTLPFARTLSIGALAAALLAAASIAGLPSGSDAPVEQNRPTLYPNPVFPAYSPWIYGNLAAADFNHDGFEDIAVVADANVVSVLLGAGDGTFAPATFHGAEFIHTPAHVRTDDFNGDGNVDLAVSDCRGYDSIHIFLGNGDGTFNPPVHSGTGFGQFSFGIGDLNGDGRDDLAVPNAWDNDVEVLLGRGDGTFETWSRLPVQLPDSIAIVDLDGDGRLDLVVTVAWSSMGILRGRGDGTFDGVVTLDPGFKSSALHVADVDEDGRPDIVALVANEGTPAGPGFGVLLGHGDGTFGPATMYGWQTRNVEGIQALAVHDVDDDGHIDVVMPAWPDQLYASVAIAFGNGDGSFGPQEIHGGAGSVSAVGFSDFNEDGRTDIAAVHVMAGGVTVLLNQGGRIFGARPPAYAAGASPNAALIADFDADARPDVAVLGRNSENVSILWGTGDGGLLPGGSFPIGGLPGPEAMAADDFDGDGRKDLAFGIPATGTVAILRSAGDGTFEPPLSFPTSAGTLHMLSVDWNHDGDPDLVTANNKPPAWFPPDHSAGTVSILLGAQGLSFHAPDTYVFQNKPYALAAGDFDADGKIDLAIMAGPSQYNTLRLVRGSDGYDFPVRTFGEGVMGLAAGDLDGDGDSDLVVTSTTVEWLRSRGDLTFDPPVVVADSSAGLGTFGRWCRIADADGDGFMDIVVVGSAIRIMPGNGDGTFDRPHAFLGASGFSAALGDLDLDGSLDIVLPTLNDVQVLLNQHAPDADQDGIPDQRDNCPTIPNPDQDPEACRQIVEDVAISMRGPSGRGAGIVSWRTTHEVTLLGFNVVTFEHGQRVQLNDSLLACEACVTGEGRSYSFLLARHRSGRDVFVETVCTSECGGPWGPAVRQ